MQAVRLLGIAPVVYRGDRGAVRITAYPERRQLLWRGEPVVVRLALGGTEEVDRLGRGPADQAEHVRIPQQRQAVGGEGFEVVAKHEDATREGRDSDHHLRLAGRRLRRRPPPDV